MKVRKEELLKKYRKTRKEPDQPERESQFALLLERELILDKMMLMMKKAAERLDIVSTSENFFQYLPSFGRILQKTIDKGVKLQVRAIIDLERSKDSIRRIQEGEKIIPSGAPVRIRYSYDSLNPLVVIDGKEVLMGTSSTQTFGVGEHAYLWSTNKTLASLLQRSFEEQWHLSVGPTAIATEPVPDKIKAFARQLRPMDHVIFIYDSQETRNQVLFNYVQAGLESGDAVVYVASEENPNEIKEDMKRFGIDIATHEKNGALRILNYDEIYLVTGRFSSSAIIDRWKTIYDRAVSKGFKRLRAVGEMGCFFKHNLLSELTEYEQAVHRALEPPIIGICVYKSDMFNQVKDPINFYNELVRVHRIVLYAGADKAVRKYEIRNT